MDSSWLPELLSGVFDDQQVQVSIVVVVNEGGAGAPGIIVTTDPGCVGEVDEATIIVAKRAIAADSGELEIRIAVVVEIAYCHPIP